MFDFLKGFVSPQKLRQVGVLGMNARNYNIIAKFNKRSLYPLVDDKVQTKKLANSIDINTPNIAESTVAAVVGDTNLLLLICFYTELKITYFCEWNKHRDISLLLQTFQFQTEENEWTTKQISNKTKQATTIRLEVL